MLVKYGVDVVASGHMHAYARTCPVIDKHCVPHGLGSVLHVVTGSGGRRLTEVGGMQTWLDHSERTYGFSRFTVRTQALQPAVQSSCLCRSIVFTTGQDNHLLLHLFAGVQVEERGEGESEMVVEFVKAADGAVTDTVTLRNSLRRDRHCSYCYSRSNGTMPRTPGVSSAGAAREVQPDCAAGHGSGDLDALAQERLAAEHPEWAIVLEDELPHDWMIAGPEESDGFLKGSLGRLLGRTGVAWDGIAAPAESGSSEELVLLEDPDAQ